MNKHRLHRAAGSLALAACLCLALQFCQTPPSAEQMPEKGGRRTDNTNLQQQMPDLSIFNLPSTWVNQNNDSMQLADLRGEVLVMALIFTHCQYACPRLVADMKGIETALPPERLPETHFVLISIDPDNDPPDTLRAFAKQNEMDPGRWTLLHGRKDDILELAVTLGVKYRKVSAIDFSHSNIISIFDQNGVLVYQQDGFGADNSETVHQIETLYQGNL